MSNKGGSIRHFIWPHFNNTCISSKFRSLCLPLYIFFLLARSFVRTHFLFFSSCLPVWCKRCGAICHRRYIPLHWFNSYKMMWQTSGTQHNTILHKKEKRKKKKSLHEYYNIIEKRRDGIELCVVVFFFY